MLDGYTIADIKALENGCVLKASTTELEDFYVGKVLVEPLVLNSEDRYIAEQSGVDIDVSHDFTRATFPGRRAIVRGTRIDLAVPFEGDPILWRIRPSTFTLDGYPQIEVREGEIQISFLFPDDSMSSERVRSGMTST